MSNMNTNEATHGPAQYTFSQALEAVKRGASIQRAGWNRKGLYVKAQFPDENSKMTLPYLYIEYPEDHPVYSGGATGPWVPNHADIMAEDWYIWEAPKIDYYKCWLEEVIGQLHTAIAERDEARRDLAIACEKLSTMQMRQIKEEEVN